MYFLYTFLLICLLGLLEIEAKSKVKKDECGKWEDKGFCTVNNGKCGKGIQLQIRQPLQDDVKCKSAVTERRIRCRIKCLKTQPNPKIRKHDHKRKKHGKKTSSKTKTKSKSIILLTFEGCKYVGKRRKYCLVERQFHLRSNQPQHCRRIIGQTVSCRRRGVKQKKEQACTYEITRENCTGNSTTYTINKKLINGRPTCASFRSETRLCPSQGGHPCRYDKTTAKWSACNETSFEKIRIFKLKPHTKTTTKNSKNINNNQIDKCPLQRQESIPCIPTDFLKSCHYKSIVGNTDKPNRRRCKRDGRLIRKYRLKTKTENGILNGNDDSKLKKNCPHYYEKIKTCTRLDKNHKNKNKKKNRNNKNNNNNNKEDGERKLPTKIQCFYDITKKLECVNGKRSLVGELRGNSTYCGKTVSWDEICN